MTFAQWFLIQAPDIKGACIIKAVILGFACIPLCMAYFEADYGTERKARNLKWFLIAFIWATCSATIGAFLPDTKQAEKIQELIKK